MMRGSKPTDWSFSVLFSPGDLLPRLYQCCDNQDAKCFISQSESWATFAQELSEDLCKLVCAADHKTKVYEL